MHYEGNMANWSPDYIPSTNLTARHRRSAGGSFDSAVVGPFSGQKRGLSQNVSGHSDGLRPLTEAYKGSTDFSRQGASVDTHVFQIE